MAPLLTVLHDLGVVAEKMRILKTTGETKKIEISLLPSLLFFSKKKPVQGNDVLRLISAGSEHFFPKNHCSKCASGLTRDPG